MLFAISLIVACLGVAWASLVRHRGFGISTLALSVWGVIIGNLLLAQELRWLGAFTEWTLTDGLVVIIVFGFAMCQLLATFLFVARTTE